MLSHTFLAPWLNSTYAREGKKKTLQAHFCDEYAAHIENQEA
jgi:hypothetical protein